MNLINNSNSNRHALSAAGGAMCPGRQLQGTQQLPQSCGLGQIAGSTGGRQRRGGGSRRGKGASRLYFSRRSLEGGVEGGPATENAAAVLRKQHDITQDSPATPPLQRNFARPQRLPQLHPRAQSHRGCKLVRPPSSTLKLSTASLSVSQEALQSLPKRNSLADVMPEHPVPEQAELAATIRAVEMTMRAGESEYLHSSSVPRGVAPSRSLWKHMVAAATLHSRQLRRSSWSEEYQGPGRMVQKTRRQVVTVSEAGTHHIHQLQTNPVSTRR